MSTINTHLGRHDDQHRRSTTAPRTRRKRALIVVIAAAMLGGSLAATAFLPAGAATVAAEALTTPPSAGSSLEWGVCPTGAPAPQQCATLTVPLVYGGQKGRTIDIEVSRIPAAKPEKRKGVLMTNGGGPGPSLDVPSALAGLLPQSVRDSYDLVAFDPRGIGYSSPMNCGRDADELVRDLQLSVLSFPSGNGSINTNVSYAKRMAKQCADNSGDLLAHLSTANVARDMDQIRRALGEHTVSYYGISWGTYLGSVYRALFPRTVDRMVIDSSVDPNVRGYDGFREFSGAMEDRWPDLATFAVAHQRIVHLGATEREARKNYLALTAALDRKPVMLTETKAPINGNFVRLFTWQLSYSDASMIATSGAPVPAMAQLWQSAGNLAASKATDTDRAFLAALANGLVAKGTLPNVPADNLFSAGWAITCGDKAWPRDIGTYARNTAADRAQFPLTAGAPSNIAPCSAWKTQPPGPTPKIKPIGKRNVLILQNDRDPSTPLNGAKGMRRALGSDAVLVTVDAGGHGVLTHPKPNACAIDSLETYLTDGKLTADKACN